MNFEVFAVLFSDLKQSLDGNKANFDKIPGAEALYNVIEKYDEHELEGKEDEASTTDPQNASDDQIKNAIALRKHIGLLNDSINLLLKSNKKTNENKEVLDAAKLLSKQSLEYYQILKNRENEIYKNVAANKNELKLPEIGKHSLDKLRNLSEVYMGIGDVNIKPKPSKYVGKMSTLGDIWGWLKHGLYSGVMAILSPISAIGMAITDRMERKKGNQRPDRNIEAQPIRTDMVPGAEGDYFPDITDEVNNGEDDQPIIDDKRRIPLLYETRIPVDPNQPPKVTFKIREAIEGDPLSFDSGERTGHSFMTIEYSKKNPLTGKLERFESTFGYFMKGGFGGKNDIGAGISTGGYIPGLVNIDTDIYDIGKSYTVTNKQINKLVLAVQNYEKGGYNAIERNCTTFLHDIGAEIGVNPEFMHENDFSMSYKNAAKIFGGQIAMGFSYSRLSADHLYKKANSEDYSYQNFGQKMVRKEDIKHLDKRGLNIRMKGYSPAQVAETLRAQEGFRLLATSDEVVIANVIDEETKKINETLFGKDAEMNPNIFRLRDYLRIRLAMLENVEKIASIETAKTNYDEYKKAAFDAVKIIDETCEELNNIYHNEFKGHSDINIPFQHLVGAFNFKKKAIKTTYNGFASYWDKKATHMLKPEVKENIIDDNLDISSTVYKLRKETIRTAKGTESIFSAVGVMLAFKTPENAVLGYGQEEEGREMKKIVSNGLPTYLAIAQESIFSNRPYTAVDYKFAFTTLPNYIAKFKAGGGYEGVDASEFYQQMALNRVIGGLKARLNTMDKEMLKKEPELLKNVITTHIISALDENTSELRKLKEGLTAGIKEKHPMEEGETEISYQERINEIAFYSLSDNIINNYVKNILEDTGLEKSINLADLSLLNNESYRKVLGDVKPRNIPGFLPKRMTYEKLLKDNLLTSEKFENIVSEIVVDTLLGKSNVEREKSGMEKNDYSPEKKQELVNKLKESGALNDVLNNISISKLRKSYQENEFSIVNKYEERVLECLVLPKLNEETKREFGLENLEAANEEKIADFISEKESDCIAGNRELTEEEYVKIFTGDQNDESNKIERAFALNRILGGLYEETKEKISKNPDKANEILEDSIIEKLSKDSADCVRFKSAIKKIIESRNGRNSHNEIGDVGYEIKMEELAQEFILKQINDVYLPRYISGTTLKNSEKLKTNLSNTVSYDKELIDRRESLIKELKDHYDNNTLDKNNIKDLINGIAALSVMEKSEYLLSKSTGNKEMFTEEKYNDIKKIMDNKEIYKTIIEKLPIEALINTVPKNGSQNYLNMVGSLIEKNLDAEDFQKLGFVKPSANDKVAMGIFNNRVLGYSPDIVLLEEKHQEYDYKHVFLEMYIKKNNNEKHQDLLKKKLLLDLFGSASNEEEALSSIKKVIGSNQEMFKMMVNGELERLKAIDNEITNTDYKKHFEKTVKPNAVDNLAYDIIELYLKPVLGDKFDKNKALKSLSEEIGKTAEITRENNKELFEMRGKYYSDLKKAIKEKDNPSIKKAITEILSIAIVGRELDNLVEGEKTGKPLEQIVNNAKKLVTKQKIANKVINDVLKPELILEAYEEENINAFTTKEEAYILKQAVDPIFRKLNLDADENKKSHEIIKDVSNFDHEKIDYVFTSTKESFENIFSGLEERFKGKNANDLLTNPKIVENTVIKFICDKIDEKKNAFINIEDSINQNTRHLCQERAFRLIGNRNYVVQNNIRKLLREYAIRPALKNVKESMIKGLPENQKEAIEELFDMSNIDISNSKELDKRFKYRTGIPQKYIDEKKELINAINEAAKNGEEGLRKIKPKIERMLTLVYALHTSNKAFVESKGAKGEFPSDDYLKAFEEKLHIDNFGEKMINSDVMNSIISTGQDMGMKLDPTFVDSDENVMLLREEVKAEIALADKSAIEKTANVKAMQI